MKMRTIIAIRTVMVFIVLTVNGCGQRNPSDELSKTSSKPAEVSGKTTLNITATTGMIADIAKEIGGPYVEVTGLMGPGTDPHLYKAREKDIRLLAQADVVLYSGLHLEGKLGDVLGKMAEKKPVIPVAEAIPERLLHRTANGGGAHDPHVWFDVTLWMMAAERIRDGLIASLPAHKTIFETRAGAVLKQLSDLHRWAKAEVATIPRERRVLITAHDAFGYFGKAYDVEVRGIQGISTEDEAGVRDINALVDFIVARNIKAVFVESSVPKKNIEALAEGCRSRGHALKIGGELFSDAMGKAGTPEGTYIGMVRHNVSTIVGALR